jgi:hypothetical protein
MLSSLKVRPHGFIVSDSLALVLLELRLRRLLAVLLMAVEIQLWFKE